MNWSRGYDISCSRRSALSSGRGWRGRSHPRPETISSTGPCHSWIREEMERVEDNYYTYTIEYQNL